MAEAEAETEIEIVEAIVRIDARNYRMDARNRLGGSVLLSK